MKEQNLNEAQNSALHKTDVMCWVAVADRLPDSIGSYLCFWENCYVGMLFFNSNKDALTREDPWEEPLTVIGPNKTDITSRHFLELVKDGCCGCGDPLTLKDAGNVSWYAAGNIQYPVCASCCHDPSFTGAIL